MMARQRRGQARKPAIKMRSNEGLKEASNEMAGAGIFSNGVRPRRRALRRAREGGRGRSRARAWRSMSWPRRMKWPRASRRAGAPGLVPACEAVCQNEAMSCWRSPRRFHRPCRARRASSQNSSAVSWWRGRMKYSSILCRRASALRPGQKWHVESSMRTRGERALFSLKRRLMAKRSMPLFRPAVKIIVVAIIENHARGVIKPSGK